MNTLKRITYLILFAFAAFATSCNKDYDAPPLDEPVYKGMDPNITLEQLKNKYPAQVGSPMKIESGLVAKVYVSANDIGGNIYKNLIVEDGSASMSIGVEQSSVYTLYRVGQEVFLNLDSLYVVNYGGELQIGLNNTNANRLPWVMFKKQVERNGWPDSTRIVPTVTTISDIEALKVGVNSIIRLDSVYFVNGGELTYADKDATANRVLKDKTGKSIDVRTSNYANFAQYKLPSGVGSLEAVLGRHNGNWQLTLRTIYDVKKFSGQTPENPDGEGKGTGTKDDPYDVVSAKAKQGEKDKWVKGYIVGCVPNIEGQSTTIKDTEFNATSPNASFSNIVIAESADEKDYTKCMTVQLPSNSAARTNLNLKDNPGVLGKEVSLFGNLVKYMGSEGIKDVSEYVLEGGEAPKPDPEVGKGTGTKEDPYDILKAKASQGQTGKWVEGYIVGSVPNITGQSTTVKDTEFNASSPNTSVSNIVIAASADEKDYTKCFTVQLPSNTAARTNLNLKDNPTALGKKVLLYGNLIKYMGSEGIKEVSDYVIEGGVTPDPEPDPEPQPKPDAGKGTGIKEDPYDFANAVAKQGESNKWIKVYIVGSYATAKASEPDFSANDKSSVSNIMVAASASETDGNKCIAVQLPSKSAVRTSLNLKDNPAMLGREVLLEGNLEKYITEAGMKSTSNFEILK